MTVSGVPVKRAVRVYGLVSCCLAVTVDELAGKQAYLLFYKRATSLGKQQDRAALLRQCTLREVSLTCPLSTGGQFTSSVCSCCARCCVCVSACVQSPDLCLRDEGEDRVLCCVSKHWMNLLRHASQPGESDGGL